MQVEDNDLESAGLTTPKVYGGDDRKLVRRRTAVIQEGGSARAVENPEKLLKEYDLFESYLPTIFAFLALVGFGTFVGVIIGLEKVRDLNEQLIWRAIGSASIIFCVISVIATGICILYANEMREESGVLLVKEWLEVVPETAQGASTFPRNVMELESCRFFLREGIACGAGYFTDMICQREKAITILEDLRRQKPAVPSWPDIVRPGELPGKREGFEKAMQKALASHRSDVMVAEKEACDWTVRADEEGKNYNRLWNLVKNLGEFYAAEVLPLNPATGKPFEGPDQHRKWLRDLSQG